MQYDKSPEKVGEIIRMLGYGDISSGDGAHAAMEEFVEDLGIRYTVRGLGVAEDVTAARLAAMVKGNIKNDPLGQDDGVVERLYAAAM